MKKNFINQYSEVFRMEDNDFYKQIIDDVNCIRAVLEF